MEIITRYILRLTFLKHVFHCFIYNQATAILAFIWVVSIAFSIFPLIGWSQYVSEVSINIKIKFLASSKNIIHNGWAVSNIIYNNVYLCLPHQSRTSWDVLLTCIHRHGVIDLMGLHCSSTAGLSHFLSFSSHIWV